MSRKRPKGVSCYRDRHGKLWWKFRGKGRASSTTKALFDSAEWWAWYNAAASGERQAVGAGAERTKPGTLNDLVVRYYTSSDWQLLSKGTQGQRRGILDRFRQDHGDKPYAALQAHHVRQILDARAATPAAANNLLKALRLLFRFAVDRNLISTDPTLGVRRLAYASDGYHTWTEDEIEAFDKRWPLGTRERLGKDLLLYTAQRSADVRKMGPQHVSDGAVTVRQQKTGAWLQVPLHPALKASIEAYPTNNLCFLTTKFGEPFTSVGFGNWVRDAARAAGLPPGVSAHGLRKAAARRLAEAGCTPHQIQAITGHKTLSEVERYTKAVRQRELADQAMARLTGTDGERTLSNPGSGLDNSSPKALNS